MELTQEQVIDHLGHMTVMEMATLVHELEEKWGVSAAPKLIAGPVPPPESIVEQTEFDLHLLSYGEKKINVIKVLRAQLPGLGLKEAKNLAESAPAVIKDGISKDEADELKTLLMEAGATVEIK